MYVCDFETVIEDFVKELPEHKCDLRILHNNHIGYMQSLTEYIEDQDFGDTVTNDLCLQCGEIWEIVWFPENIKERKHVYGSTLLDAMRKVSSR